jgi:hypothetical protein
MTASAGAALSPVLIRGDRRTPFAGLIHHPNLSARPDRARRSAVRPSHFVPPSDAWPHEPQAGNAAWPQLFLGLHYLLKPRLRQAKTSFVSNSK